MPFVGDRVAPGVVDGFDHPVCLEFPEPLANRRIADFVSVAVAVPGERFRGEYQVVCLEELEDQPVFR